MSNLFYLSQCWDCEKCSHESNCIGKKLTTEQQDALTRSITCRRPFQSGQKIYQIEKKFHSLFVIKSGAVMLQTITEEGDLFITHFYFPGDIVGIDSIGSDYYRNDAIALEATTVCEIPYSQLEKLYFSTPSLHHDVITRLAKTIISIETRLIWQGSQKQLEDRVIDCLSMFSDGIGRIQRDGSIKIRLPMKKSMIANYLAVNPESLSRSLNKLVAHGMIENKAHEIVILKPSKLFRSYNN